MELVMQDDSLPHQIRFVYVGNNVGVSCNCRETVMRGGVRKIEPMQQIEDIPQAWEVYNDPANHFRKFDPEKDRGGPDAVRQRRGAEEVLHELAQEDQPPAT